MEVNSRRDLPTFNSIFVEKAICIRKSKYGLGAFAAQNIVKNTYIGGRFEKLSFF